MKAQLKTNRQVKTDPANKPGADWLMESLDLWTHQAHGPLAAAAAGAEQELRSYMDASELPLKVKKISFSTTRP